MAVLGRALWAACNTAEQLVVRVHERQPYPLISSFLLVMSVQFLLGLILLFTMADFTQVSTDWLWWLLPAGLLNMTGTIPYFMALQKDEAYNVVPYFAFAPVFTMVLAYIFFNEHMTSAQIGGALIVIACGALFSWNFKRSTFAFRAMGLMALASIIFAFFQICLRQMSSDIDPWFLSGAVFLIDGIIALLVLAIHRPLRQSVCNAIKQSRGHTLTLGIITNALDILGLTCLLFAYTHAPTMGQVQALWGVQPFITFFISVFLGVFASRFFKPVTFSTQTLIKLALMGGIFMGVYLLV